MASIKDERDQDDPNFVKTHCTEYVVKFIIKYYLQIRNYLIDFQMITSKINYKVQNVNA